MEEREDFVKIRGSFYAGANSLVGRSIAREEKERRKLERLEDWLRCAWCNAWNKLEDLKDFKEAFDARGGSYRCPVFQQHQDHNSNFDHQNHHGFPRNDHDQNLQSADHQKIQVRSKRL